MLPTLAAAILAAAVIIVIAYAVWLTTAPRPTAASAPFTASPVLIIVPVYDEAQLIESKLDNLAALSYPAAQRRIVIVDGGSGDSSAEIVEQWIDSRQGFELLRTHHRDKTAQIASALRANPNEEWVLVTDADAVLPPDAISDLMNAAAMDVGVVGARVQPRTAHPLELLHWRTADWLRERESRRGSAAIVTAPCYLTRRELIESMPADAVADDVHVACRAMAAGYRVRRAAFTVFELRSPGTIRALVSHKYRKADAYLREIFRFLPAARQMPRPMRTIFLFRVALLTVVPILGAVGGALAIAAMLDRAPLAAAAMGVVIAGLAAMARNFGRAVALATMLVAVALAALIRLPMSRQTASFPKVLECEDGR